MDKMNLFGGNDKSSKAPFSKDNTNTNQGEDTQEINILEELAKDTIYRLSKLPPDTQRSVAKACTNMMDILSNQTSERASITEILFQRVHEIGDEFSQYCEEHEDVIKDTDTLDTLNSWLKNRCSEVSPNPIQDENGILRFRLKGLVCALMSIRKKKEKKLKKRSMLLL